jgi:hypothetical protein
LILLKIMEASLLPETTTVAIPVKRFLLTEQCPAEWRRYDLYIFRDKEIVFYVGQSHIAFVRVWEHLVQGFKGRSIVGRFIWSNWPASMSFTIELLSSRSSRFNALDHDLDATERQLIETLAPSFNEALNSHPTPLPELYRPPFSNLRCSRSLKHLMREADYAVKADEKRLYGG